MGAQHYMLANHLDSGTDFQPSPMGFLQVPTQLTLKHIRVFPGGHAKKMRQAYGDEPPARSAARFALGSPLLFQGLREVRRLHWRAGRPQSCQEVAWNKEEVQPYVCLPFPKGVVNGLL